MQSGHSGPPKLICTNVARPNTAPPILEHQPEYNFANLGHFRLSHRGL